MVYTEATVIRTGFVWKQIGRNRGRAIYVAEGNTVGLRPGDSIEVERRDGIKSTYVVRCVTREDERVEGLQNRVTEHAAFGAATVSAMAQAAAQHLRKLSNVDGVAAPPTVSTYIDLFVLVSEHGDIEAETLLEIEQLLANTFCGFTFELHIRAHQGRPLETLMKGCTLIRLRG